MPRFNPRDKASDDEGVIDVYDCTNDGKDEEFWTRQTKLDVDDPNYKCSLKLPGNKDMKSFQKVIFSEHNRYACVQCKSKLLIFDIMEGATLEINAENSMRKCNPVIERSLLDTTYDRILSIYFNDEMMSNDDKMLDCWVILQSSQYG